MSATDPCDGKCLAKIRELLVKNHDGAEVHLKLEAYIVRESLDAPEFKTNVDLPPLRYSWGEGRKQRKGYVNFTYCPFCGKRK